MGAFGPATGGVPLAGRARVGVPLAGRAKVGGTTIDARISAMATKTRSRCPFILLLLGVVTHYLAPNTEEWWG
jgi:hypothetical protein